MKDLYWTNAWLTLPPLAYGHVLARLLSFGWSQSRQNTIIEDFTLGCNRPHCRSPAEAHSLISYNRVVRGLFRLCHTR